MKYLIVGLGNIGSEYSETRHNIGFKIVDNIAKKAGIAFKTERYGDVCEVKVKNKTLVLLKPSTYMNLSGKAMNYWMQKLGLEISNVLVLVDDIAIPFGSIRIRTKGSDGGHNGLKNINEILGHNSYARVRFGIGGDFPKGFQIDYVLGKWSKEEIDAMDERLDMAGEAVKSFALAGIERTMNSYNKK